MRKTGKADGNAKALKTWTRWKAMKAWNGPLWTSWNLRRTLAKSRAIWSRIRLWIRPEMTRFWNRKSFTRGFPAKASLAASLKSLKYLKVLLN